MAARARSIEEPGIWTARTVWLLLPFVAGPAFSAALDPRIESFRLVASALLWAAWAVVLVALLVPRTVSLTIIRTVMPAGVIAGAWAGLALPDGEPAWKALAAVVAGVLAAGAALSPLLGDVFVNGSAYGPERRMPLRVPGSLLILTPVSWLVALAGLCAGPLLLASHEWVAGSVATIVGLPAAWFAIRALHGLARRWVVFVPAGLVLHDPFGLPDAVLFPRRMIHHLGPASAEATEHALDATQRSPGLALLLELTEPLPIGVREGRMEVGSIDTDRLLFTPTRPGAVLAEASQRRIPV